MDDPKDSQGVFPVLETQAWMSLLTTSAVAWCRNDLRKPPDGLFRITELGRLVAITIYIYISLSLYHYHYIYHYIYIYITIYIYIYIYHYISPYKYHLVLVFLPFDLFATKTSFAAETWQLGPTACWLNEDSGSEISQCEGLLVDSLTMFNQGIRS